MPSSSTLPRLPVPTSASHLTTRLRFEIKNNLNDLMEKISETLLNGNLKLFASYIDDTGKLEEEGKKFFNTSSQENITVILQEAFDKIHNS